MNKTFIFVIAAMLIAGGAVRGETEIERELAQYKKDLARYEQESASHKPDKKLAEQVRKDRLKEEEAVKKALQQKIRDTEVRLREMEKRRDTEVDETKGGSNICPVHQRKMEAKQVEIRYGMPMPLSEWAAPTDVVKNQFPFAQTYYLGGDMWNDYSPKRAKIYVCPDCVAAEKKWLAEHPQGK